MDYETLRKLKEEEVHDLNFIKYLGDYFKIHTDLMLNPFFSKYAGQFDGLLNKKIYDDGVTVRKEIFDFLDKECSAIVKNYNDDYDNFINKYGWYENFAAGKRHQITRDELSHDLCELIREIYYVYMENQFPERYKISVNEEFLMRGDISSKFS